MHLSKKTLFKRHNLLNGEPDEEGDKGDPESWWCDKDNLDKRPPALEILADHQRGRVPSHPDSDAWKNIDDVTCIFWQPVQD